MEISKRTSYRVVHLSGKGLYVVRYGTRVYFRKKCPRQRRKIQRSKAWRGATPRARSVVPSILKGVVVKERDVRKNKRHATLIKGCALKGNENTNQIHVFILEECFMEVGRVKNRKIHLRMFILGRGLR